MNNKFSRRYFFKNFIRQVGETSVDTLRSYNLGEVVVSRDSEKAEENSKTRPRIVKEELAVPLTRTKK